MTTRTSARRGNAVLEFTLVGIPLLFVLISIFEVARGMWVYHTLAHAVRDGTRYAIVHGQNCAITPNVCSVTVAQIAAKIQNAGVGLIPDQLTVTMSTASGTTTLYQKGPALLSAHLGDASPWPTGPTDVSFQPGNDVVITAVFPFRSALSMFWPGAGPVQFGTFNLPAMSRDRIQF